MLQLDFTTNPNGKLFNDIFGDIRLYSHAFAEGTECEVYYKEQRLGTAVIETMRTFPFSRISDVVAYLNCGHPAPYQAALLNRYYNGGKMLAADAVLSHMVLRYTSRNMETQNILMKHYWEELQTA